MSEQRDKIDVLRKLLHILNPSKAIVFVGEKNETEIYTAKLKFHGFKAEGIHGDNIKSDRKRTLDDFRAGRLNLLIASDIAARGLDIEGVTHIFNINMPEEPRDYLHRVGRTGRVGNAGIAISIVNQRELPMVRQLEKALNIQITPKDMYKGNIVEARVQGVQRSK